MSIVSLSSASASDVGQKDGVGGAVSKRRRVAGQLIGARLVGWEGLVFLR